MRNSGPNLSNHLDSLIKNICASQPLLMCFRSGMFFPHVAAWQTVPGPSRILICFGKWLVNSTPIYPSPPPPVTTLCFVSILLCFSLTCIWISYVTGWLSPYIININDQMFNWKTVSSRFLKIHLWHAWVAQSVKHLPSAQVMISGSWDWVPHGVPYSAGSLLLPLPLPLPTVYVCMLSLIQINKINLKNRLKSHLFLFKKLQCQTKLIQIDMRLITWLIDMWDYYITNNL